MTHACHRWLGFIHPLGFTWQRETEDKEKINIREQIERRVGAPLKPGPLTFAGRQFTVIEDDGLLRLGRAALAVISHVLREPHLPAVITGCMTEAIMGHPDKYELFAWVIRSSSTDLWPSLEPEIRELLRHDIIVNQQAAHRLLTFVGTPEALAIKRQLRDNLFPPSPLKELIKQHPCTNKLYLWRRQDCLHCLKRTDLDISLVATQLQHYGLDPDFDIPLHIKQGLCRLGTDNLGSEFWVHRGRTAEDHMLEEIEPALCAYAPDTLVDLIRRIVSDITNREGVSLWGVAVELHRHALILGEYERQCVASAWEKLVDSSDEWPRLSQQTETWLLSAFIHELEPMAQLERLWQRTAQALQWTMLENKFKAFEDIADWQSITQQLNLYGDLHTLTCIVWFLSANPTAIPDETLELIYSLTTHEDAVVRLLALKIVYQSGRIDIAKRFSATRWSWHMTDHYVENYWGSLLLIDYSHLPFDVLLARIHPLYFDYALKRCGMQDSDLLKYAEFIHNCWGVICDQPDESPSHLPPCEMYCRNDDVTAQIVGRYALARDLYSRPIQMFNHTSIWGGKLGNHRSDDVSVDNVLKPLDSEQQRELLALMQIVIDQQEKEVRHWFKNYISSQALEVVVDKYPAMLAKWLMPIINNQPKDEKLLFFGRGFYESLCDVLLRNHPLKGLQLYARLSASEHPMRFINHNTEIAMLDYALFRVPTSIEAEQAWLNELDSCKTNSDLLGFVIVAEAGTASDWLHTKIRTELQSKVLFYRARAILLLAFSDIPDAHEVLENLIKDEPESWLDEIAEEALRQCCVNQWAKHWYRQFLTALDDVGAWASFRLFLRCADRRFWHWRETISGEVGDEKRRIFLEDNRDVIKNAIKHNEKKLGDKFLNQRTMSNQIWPWQETSFLSVNQANPYNR